MFNPRLYKETFLEHNFLWTQWKKLKHFEFLSAGKNEDKEEKLIDTSEGEEEEKTNAEDQTMGIENVATGSGNLSNKFKVYAKIENNFHLSNKYALFYNMRKYYLAQERDPFEVLPLTFHIKEGVSDQAFNEFQVYFKKIEI